MSAGGIVASPFSAIGASVYLYHYLGSEYTWDSAATQKLVQLGGIVAGLPVGAALALTSPFTSPYFSFNFIKNKKYTLFNYLDKLVHFARSSTVIAKMLADYNNSHLPIFSHEKAIRAIFNDLTEIGTTLILNQI